MIKMKTWVKCVLLSIVIVAAIGYLLFVGIMNFLTASTSQYIDLFYWSCLILHIFIMVICVLYLIEKIKYWIKSN
jgi:hypothetical protein